MPSLCSPDGARPRASPAARHPRMRALLLQPHPLRGPVPVRLPGFLVWLARRLWQHRPESCPRALFTADRVVLCSSRYFPAMRAQHKSSRTPLPLANRSSRSPDALRRNCSSRCHASIPKEEAQNHTSNAVPRNDQVGSAEGRGILVGRFCCFVNMAERGGFEPPSPFWGETA